MHVRTGAGSDPPRPRAHRVRRRLAPSAGAGVLAAGGVAVLVVARTEPAVDLGVPGWVLAALVTLAIVGTDRVDAAARTRAEPALRILRAVPLAFGFLTLSSTVLIVTVTVAGIVDAADGSAQDRRDALRRVVRHTGRVALVALVLAVLGAIEIESSGRQQLAALVATVVAIAPELVVPFIPSRHRTVATDWHELLGPTGVAVTAAAAGILTVAALSTDRRAIVLLSILAVGLAAAERSRAQDRLRTRGLQAAMTAADELGSDRETDEVIGDLVAETRRLLRSERAGLLLVDDLATGTGRHSQVDPDGVLTVGTFRGDADPLWARVTADGGVVHLGRRPSQAGDPVLAAVGCDELLAAPLGAGRGCVGALWVADPSGDPGRYVAGDRELLQALARQARPALERGRLVDRLRAEAHEREHLLFHDHLTDLPNRARLIQFLDAALGRIRPEADAGPPRPGEPIPDRSSDRASARPATGVIVLGIDDFRDVNETVGWERADQVLVEVGRRLVAAVRSTDTVARIAGDEFAIMLASVQDAGAARAQAERLLDVLAEPLEVEGLALDLRAAAGVAVAPEHGRDASRLLRRADIALRRAKDGHNRVELADPAVETQAPRRLALATALRHAIERRELVLHYQPKVDLARGTVVGVEALVRWPHPERGLIPPDEFVPVAERTGLIRPLTALVLDLALRQRAAWLATDLPLDVAVNVSARNLLDPGLPERVATAVRRTRCPASALTIEVTESQLMADPERAASVLGRLHELGVVVSIDDFGTGFSSLSSLRALPVDEIKVDRSFVAGLTASDHDAAIVRSTVDLGHNLGMQVVAEGVEDATTLDALVRIGCDVVQGFYLARPMPPAELAAWLVRTWQAGTHPATAQLRGRRAPASTA